MVRKKIKDRDKLKLAVLSGGRCNLCNRYVLEDIITKDPIISLEHAHIVADSDEGPRGDYKIDKQKNNIDNIMILCPSCHTIIDKNPDKYTVQYLRKIKQDHEKRIKYLTSLSHNNKINLVIYKSKINKKDIFFDIDQINESIFKQGYFYEDKFDLSTSTTIPDHDADYYREKKRDLDNKFSKFEGEMNKHTIMLFALAPQPLLIYLGTKFEMSHTVLSQQRFRITESWNWIKTKKVIDFDIIEPSKITKTNSVCLIVEISDKVDETRIKQVLKDSDIWKITTNNPNMNIIKTISDVKEFGNTTMKLFSRIKKVYGNDKEINVFPVVPNSIAIEFGRVWMPKINNKLIVYDQIKKEGRKYFSKALEIL
jgi:5-methylcytosine-specific restriction endonuclease McrA